MDWDTIDWGFVGNRVYVEPLEDDDYVPLEEHLEGYEIEEDNGVEDDHTRTQ